MGGYAVCAVEQICAWGYEEMEMKHEHEGWRLIADWQRLTAVEEVCAIRDRIRSK